MKRYYTRMDTIVSLHERGFTEDFAHSGNNLFWIQQQVLLSPNDYNVLESHHFNLPGIKSYTVLGIIIRSNCAKGILILQQPLRPKAVSQLPRTILSN